MMAAENTHHHYLVFVFSVFLVKCVASESQKGMSTRHFRGIPSIQEVECWGGDIDSGAKLMSLQMFGPSESSVLASLNLYTKTCMTYGELCSCVIDENNLHHSRLRVLVHDLQEGQSREYRCTAIALMPSGTTQSSSWRLMVRRPKTTTTSTTTTTTTTTTVRPSNPRTNDVGDQPKHLSVQKGTLKEFYVPPIVLIVGLCLIVFLALLSMVLIILQCRRSGRRKRRNRAANRESLLSAKSEQAGCSSSTKDLDLGCTTYRATRSFPTFAPGPPHAVPPPQAGQLGAMRYQKGAPDDTGYVSGSSNHYSEPYACHDEGTQERTRSAPRSGLPQIKGSPQPPRLPDNHP